MIDFSINKYKITVYIGEEPIVIDYYKKHAVLIDDKGLNENATAIYVIISKNLIDPQYLIIAFSTDPVGYGGFKPGIHYEETTQTLFIGAGAVIKTYNLEENKLIFEKSSGMGFWGWEKIDDYVIQKEEIDFGIFNTKGQKLWETFVSPPYDFKILGKHLILKDCDTERTIDIETGKTI